MNHPDQVMPKVQLSFVDLRLIVICWTAGWACGAGARAPGGLPGQCAAGGGCPAERPCGWSCCRRRHLLHLPDSRRCGRPRRRGVCACKVGLCPGRRCLLASKKASCLLQTKSYGGSLLQLAASCFKFSCVCAAGVSRALSKARWDGPGAPLQKYQPLPLSMAIWQAEWGLLLSCHITMFGQTSCSAALQMPHVILCRCCCRQWGFCVACNRLTSRIIAQRTDVDVGALHLHAADATVSTLQCLAFEMLHRGPLLQVGNNSK